MSNIIEKQQTIYFNMDDSGVLTRNNPSDKIFVYGGIFFLSLKEQEEFTRKYKSLINKIKPNYCSKFKEDKKLDKNYCLSHNFKNCKFKCPELKSNMINKKDRCRILTFLKHYNTAVAIADNYKLHDYVFENSASRGRFKDYMIKRLVKETLKDLIAQNKINPNIQTNLILNLDEQTTLSNGYYNLQDSIKEELQYGVYNYDYNIEFKPILSKVTVKINYRDSYYYFPVQAADLIVGDIRHAYYNYLSNKNFEEYKNRTKFVNKILSLT